MTHLLMSLVLVVFAWGIGGCAALACRPTPITIAAKDERSRLEARPGLPRTTADQGMAEEVRPTLVREFWVRSDGGQWYRISERQYKTVNIGQSIEVCQ